MTALRRRLLDDLPLRGLAPKTPQGALDAVTHLAHHDRQAPDQIGAEEIRPYGRSGRQATQVAERP